jgi:hypothetical protein
VRETLEQARQDAERQRTVQQQEAKHQAEVHQQQIAQLGAAHDVAIVGLRQELWMARVATAAARDDRALFERQRDEARERLVP